LRVNAARRAIGLLPRTWTASIDQLRRDVRMVTGGLAGRRVSPFVERGSGGARRPSLALLADPPAPSVLAPRTLRIARVVRETADAVSLHLEDTTGAPIAFRAGQFLTVLLTIDGEVLRRAYSLSSVATDARSASITIKRVPGGRVSNHINDTLAAGMSLDVLGPSGSFTAERAEADGASRHLVLLAGGRGITPMVSIARTVLAEEPGARVTLVYGNRGEADIIFKDALAALVAAHPARFMVRHVLETPPEGWSGGVGLLGRARVAAELDAAGAAVDASYFLCGPEAMMTEARAALVARGVTEERIKEERFASPHLRAARSDDDAALRSPQLLTLRIGGEERELNVAPAQTILEAGLAAGLAMPYSCAMGGCAACKVKLHDGEVEMEEPNCLTASERGAGYVLACVSRLKRASRAEVE
jgi:ferredoxin-NADP reductase